ncbi:hypothetical protein J6Y50_05000 [bacterium]|nr:hypothetical protein [bacterium]
MKKIFNFFFCLALLSTVVSCDGKRPDNGILEFDLTVRAVQKNAQVKVFDGETEVLSGKTDENGEMRFESVRNIGELKVEVCGGTLDLVSSDEAVAWNGCCESSVKAAEEKNIVVTVDFFSSFIEKYRSATSKSEWSGYLDISGDVFPELQSSLTDATKRYLWSQAFAKIAETVSAANDTQAETQFSTENLLNMLYDDLADDNVINGSTHAKFGSAAVGAAFMKGLLADFLSEVSDKFSAAELKEWSEKIRNSQAEFLGGEEAGESGVSINIEVYPEGNKGAVPEYFSGAVEVEAKAEPENMIVALNCSADGEKLADKNEDAAYFHGSFTTANIEDEKDVLIRCEASNGVTVESAEKTIHVNNEAPLIHADFYRHGTLDLTAAEDDPAHSSIDIKVEATHKRYVVEDVSCTLEGYVMENQSGSSDQYKAVVDTEKLPDGKNILECSVLVNKREYRTSFPFYTKNTVSVRIKAFITNPLSSFESVSVSCGGSQKSRSGEDPALSEDEVKVKLGQVCIVSVSGGVYDPAVSENSGSRHFNGTLSAVFIPVSDEDVVVTPLTTVGTYIFASRRNQGNINDEELFNLVSEHLSQHLSHAFGWNEDPLNTNAADGRSKYFVLLAGLEYLAYFMETNIGSEHGIYDVSNVLRLLQEDYQDTVFNGKNGETQLFFGDDAKKTELDSNFFRYYYALSVKRFLTSSFNETVFNQLGTIVGKIASNSDQFLFPAESVPVPVDSQGPKIEISGFHDLFEAEDEDGAEITGDLGSYTKGGFVQYDLQHGVMPHFAKAFLLKFRVTPENGSFADLDSVALKSNDPDFVFRVKRIEPQTIAGSGFSDESLVFTMLAEYSDEGAVPMEKQIPFSISAQDIAYNVSEKEFPVFLDNKKPLLNMNYPEGTVRSEDVDISWNASDSLIESIKFTLSKWEDEETVVFENISESCSAGECSFMAEDFAEALLEAGLAGSASDGLYKAALTAVDHAGNSSTLYGSFKVDTTPPDLPLIRVESDGRVLLGNGVTNKNYFSVSLVDPGEDVAKWAFKVSCRGSEGNSVHDKTLGYAASGESLDFFNLITPSTDSEVVKCSGFLSVCDEVGNCTNEDFEEAAGSVFIDDRAPGFISYDTENSIFTECVPGASQFFTNSCVDSPNCNNGGYSIAGKRKPQILISYTDNFSVPENIRLFIQSSEVGWIKSCLYVPNVNSGGMQGDCNKFYCSLDGSVNGMNNFMLTAYDEVGNRSEHPLALQMDFAAVEPLKVNLKEKFFTSNGKSYLWWETKSGVDYKCTITKQGNANFSSNCSNNSDIIPSMLSGSGYYTVTVESSSTSTKRTDVAGFKFFDIADLNLSLEPQKGQFLHSGDPFKVKISADSGGMAEISKVELYLYGRYLNGVLQDSTEKLVVSRSYPLKPASLNTLFSAALPIDSIGQFRNMKVRVTFSDSTSFTKKFTENSANAFLYCLLSSDETPDSAAINFKNKALSVSFNAPECLAANDYTLTLNAEMPSACEGVEALSHSVSVLKNYQNDFTVKGDFVFFKDEHHNHTFDCNSFNLCLDMYHSCAVETHSFASDTKLKIAYGSGKIFTVLPPSNVQCSSSETEVIFYDGEGDYDEYDNKDCKKCRNKLSQPASCFGGKHKTIVLE